MAPPEGRALVREALALLGTRRLVLAIHDGNFPTEESEDIGRSSPYGGRARDLVRYAHALGFDALQLGPQGKTSLDNASPYDGTYLSRNTLSLDLFALARDPETAAFVPRERLDRAATEWPRRDSAHGAYSHAAHANEAILDAFHAAFAQARADGDRTALALDRSLQRFRRVSAWWLDRDALYDALSRAQGGVSYLHFRDARDGSLFARSSHDHADTVAPPRFFELMTRHAAAVERYALGQLLWQRQHASFRDSLQALGMASFGDLQVGGAPSDAWSLAALFLPGYRMGAPPSRTNPDGQPWGYQVLDPALYRAGDEEGAAVAFVRARVGKLLDEHDGMRVDHPHGLVCPWVYREDDSDPLHAVQHGARLFSSPDLPDHPDLRQHAIATAAEIDSSVPRYADGWVRSLDEAAVARYAVLIDTCVDAFTARGRDVRDFACEVLSTMPYPLGRVIARHGLGRFRVTQKAKLDDPHDVYRSENASARDWVMVGTHDTPPIFRTARAWSESERQTRAGYLASRLGDPTLAARAARDIGTLVHAQIADLFVSPAEQVVIFVADLFGLTDVYNAPGTTSDANWTLRLGSDFEARHATATAAGNAVDLGRALAMALGARPDLGELGASLASRLNRVSAG